MANWADRLAKLAQALGLSGTVPDTSISTAETDTELRLAPDGAGGVEWGTGGESVDLSIRSIIRDELFLATTSFSGGLTQSNSGGTIANTSGSVDVSHPGVVSVATGVGTTGRAAIISGSFDSLLLGGGAAHCTVIALVLNLSDGTETFTVRMGLSDLPSGDPVDGVFFRYTHSVNTGKWEAVCRSNSVETAADTGIAADTNWHRFEIMVNAAGTSVDFLIDGTVVATVTTNIPTGAGRFTAPMPVSIIKSAGTTSRTLRLDAFAYIFEFTTPR